MENTFYDPNTLCVNFTVDYNDITAGTAADASFILGSAYSHFSPFLGGTGSRAAFKFRLRLHTKKAGSRSAPQHCFLHLETLWGHGRCLQ